MNMNMRVHRSNLIAQRTRLYTDKARVVRLVFATVCI